MEGGGALVALRAMKAHPAEAGVQVGLGAGGRGRPRPSLSLSSSPA